MVDIVFGFITERAFLENVLRRLFAQRRLVTLIKRSTIDVYPFIQLAYQTDVLLHKKTFIANSFRFF